jgi:Glutaredoxin and related proteins
VPVLPPSESAAVQQRRNVKELPIDGDAIKREEMIQRSGRTTVPQIFIDAQHIGGCDDLYALDARGGLDPLLS